MKRRRALPTVEGTVGDMMRKLRLRAGLTQDDLAKRTYLSVAAFSLVERDKRHPSRDLLVRFAQALDLSDIDRDLLLIVGGYAPEVLLDRPVQYLRQMIGRWHAEAEKYEQAA